MKMYLYSFAYGEHIHEKAWISIVEVKEVFMLTSCMELTGTEYVRAFV
jgi:hypothetical protein